jgi:hypothetical protein
VIDISMIPVNYDPMEGIIFVVAGPFSMDRYIRGDDWFIPPWG